MSKAGAMQRFLFVLCLACLATIPLYPAYAAQSTAQLPPNVKAVWDLNNAYREPTPTRERICINGLWRWQPASTLNTQHSTLPQDGWGFFKVPGCWPDITDYMQKDTHTDYPNPAWQSE